MRTYHYRYPVRLSKDWELFMQEVLEEHYPEASKVVVVMDNLNTAA